MVPNKLRGPVLRSDEYVFRGPGGLEFCPGCLPSPWHLAAAGRQQQLKEQRLLMWGDSTIKRTFQNLLALARAPCNMTAWPRGTHLERWADPAACKPVPSGQADPAQEAALKGCTAGAEWATVPLGVNSPDMVQ